VELEGVTRRFGRTVAIDGVTFDARPGEVLGLLGPNGAGKSTTMRVLTGYLEASSGVVRVGGEELTPRAHDVKRLLGYMPEASALYPEMGVAAYVTFWARLRGIDRRTRPAAVERALRSAGLVDVAGQRIGTLSRGYRQRVGLAQAIVHDPPVLVLDEPTAGLDPRQVVEARNLIRRLAKRHTVILSSHVLSEVTELCRRVVILRQGKVVAVDEVAALTHAGGSPRVEVVVRRDPARAAQLVAALPSVSHVDRRGATLVVTGEGGDLGDAVAAAVSAGGLGLAELRVPTGSSLEDAYLRLVDD
jgi:ABC-2 type transport system ATP-binding protein